MPEKQPRKADSAHTIKLNLIRTDLVANRLNVLAVIHILVDDTRIMMPRNSGKST